MNIKDFYQQIARMEQGMGKWDRFKSSPVYLLLLEVFVFFFCIFLFSIFNTLAIDGVISNRQLSFFLGFVIFPLPIYLGIRFFRGFHLNNPKRKLFFSKRLAAMTQALLTDDTTFDLNKKGNKPLELSGLLPVVGSFKVKYTMDLMANQGGIILGGPAKIPRKLKDTTFYWLLSCGTVLPDMNVSFDNRGGSPEKVDFIKFQENTEFTREEFRISLEAVMKKTVLKGELRIQNKQFTLYLFDNVKSIDPLSGEPVFKHSASKKSNEETRSFENVYRLLHLFSKGSVPNGEKNK